MHLDALAAPRPSGNDAAPAAHEKGDLLLLAQTVPEQA